MKGLRKRDRKKFCQVTAAQPPDVSVRALHWSPTKIMATVRFFGY
ncbi:LOW QUALITY PROTEIN: hypothetical protein TorRG33x02_235180 [Trema orientale]|uniref:Uncharacterized protein n=1 Tax=Trema orientale TaxID=63057 RepID=A0A2P5E2X6_TREOI|nr:LOW QUALITY PROTEIN: hypothetical protein TorRG33x02_235180 [Trema orientale]